MANQHNKLELRWHGKDIWEAPEPRLLVEKDHFKGKKGIDDNLLIYGDNLLGLKSLEKDYTGKIKCIYIDPPYNTKSCFKHYDDSLEHSIWLNMMKERLFILHRLLRKDGTIWISIDDDESHYLKVLCDEIFGRKNFIANVIWEKKYTSQNDAKWLSDVHDHILIYAKCHDFKTWNLDNTKRGLNLLPRTDAMDSSYKNPDNDPRGVWRAINLSVKTYSKNNDYVIEGPTGKKFSPPFSRAWAVNKTKYHELLVDNRIWFGKDKQSRPYLKTFLTEVQQGYVAKSIWSRLEVGDNKEAKNEAKEINSKDVFATPKPERLVERILYLATNQGDIVLDCFAGSGTTGAVAHKMGRRWIMIELGEHCHTHIIPRMEKVINGEDLGGVTEQVGWKGGGGFKYYELAPSLLEKNKLGRWTLHK